VTPVFLAFRRLRARRTRALAGACAVAVAVGLLLAVSVLGASAREESARGRVADLPVRERLVQVAVHVQPGDDPARESERALAGLGLGGRRPCGSAGRCRRATSAGRGWCWAASRGSSPDEHLVRARC
jgi:hypothetical protein